MDLVRCDICGKWVCEECNDVAVSKLKLLMSKCKTLYFICKGCNEMSHDDNIKEILADTTEVHSVVEKRNNTDLVKSLKTLFDKKITQMESKLERLIDTKLDKKIDATNLYNIKEQESVSATTTQENKKYSDIIKGPMDFRQIMQEARNEEKVEEREKEKRSKNFIIHGLEENGKAINVMKINDTQVINCLLERIGVRTQLESFTRLGKPTETKRRTIKVTMKNNQDKWNVMSNLRRLKNYAKEFGKISVTDDYTSGEREQIRCWVKKAEEKSSKDPEYVYRVRGNPKNGLRLVTFTRQKLSNI